MAWIKIFILLLLAGRGDTLTRVDDSEQGDDSSSYSEDETASNRTNIGTSYLEPDTARLEDVCPFSINATTTRYDFVTMSATKCGSVACCRFTPLTQYIATWAKVNITPVTVGAEVVVIDVEQDLTSTITEYISTAIVLTLNSGVTTLDPSLWLADGALDGGTDMPTRSTVWGSAPDAVTITYPSAYVALAEGLSWYGSLPIVNAGTTSCLQFDGGTSSVPVPTFVSTPEMTADPTDPKGLFYYLAPGVDRQIPGANFDLPRSEWSRVPSRGCGGDLASGLLESWRPTDLIVSVYSTCLCDAAVQIAPAAPAETVSTLLETTTRYDRLPRIAKSPPLAAQRTSSAPSEPRSSEPVTNTNAAPAPSTSNTVQSATGTDDQIPSKALDIVSAITDASPSQNAVPTTGTRTVESTRAPSPTLSTSSPQPSSQIKSTQDTSASEPTVSSASSWSAPSVEKSVAPPSSSSSPEVPMSSAPSAETATELQSVQTQSDIVKPQFVQPTSSETESLTQNSTPVSSSASQGSADLGLPSQPTTQSPTVLVKPVPASSQSAATSSDAPPDAVVVADGQLSMVSVKPSGQSGPSLRSSSIQIGDIIADGIGLTKESSTIETTSHKSVTAESSPTTRTEADTKTSSPIDTTSHPSRTSEPSQTRSPTSQKSTSRVIASPTRASSSSRSSETTRATGDIIASVMGVTRSTGSASRLWSERWMGFAVGLLIFHIAV